MEPKEDRDYIDGVEDLIYSSEFASLLELESVRVGETPRDITISMGNCVLWDAFSQLALNIAYLLKKSGNDEEAKRILMAWRPMLADLSVTELEASFPKEIPNHADCLLSYYVGLLIKFTYLVHHPAEFERVVNLTECDDETYAEQEYSKFNDKVKNVTLGALEQLLGVRKRRRDA